MRQTHASIERVTRITADLARVEVATDFAPGSIRPGQYLLVRLRPAWEPYLRERWTPVRFAGGLMLIDRPGDDVLMPGDTVDILGPCGKPFPLRPGAERFLLIVQNTSLTPLIALIEETTGAGKSATVVLEGEAQRYPPGELPREVEILHAPQAWGWLDQVDAIKWADQIIALAPPHRALERYAQLWSTINQLRAPAPAGFALGYFNLPAPCGVGACGACLVPGKHGDICACTDGPALDLAEISF
ncbi:MAG: hypothetical protein JXB47_13695 [Anaerolineae bacterium]|nr:hypothetical protein [Anaerolineae bacterium]